MPSSLALVGSENCWKPNAPRAKILEILQEFVYFRCPFFGSKKPPTSRFGCLLGLLGASWRRLGAYWGRLGPSLGRVLGHSSAYGGSCWAAVEAENVCHRRKRQLLENPRLESENIGNHAGIRIFMRSQLLPDKTRPLYGCFYGPAGPRRGYY